MFFTLVIVSLCVLAFSLEHNYQQEYTAMIRQPLSCKHNQVVTPLRCDFQSLTKQESAKVSKELLASNRQESALIHSYSHTQDIIALVLAAAVLVVSILMVSILVRQDRYQLFSWAIPLSIICLVSSLLGSLLIEDDDGAYSLVIVPVAFLSFTLAWMLVLALFKGMKYLLNRA